MELRSRKGFSLIELMVAIGILSLGMAGVGTMLFQSFQFDRSNAKQRRAQIAATQIAERIRGGNPPAKDPDDLSGTAKRLPPSSSTCGNGVIIGTDLYWQSSTKKDGAFFCKWTTYSPSGIEVTDWSIDGSVPESGSVMNIVLGWGSGKCARDSVETCPRTYRIVLILSKNN